MGLENQEHFLDIERGEELFARKKLLGIENNLLDLEKLFSAYINVELPHPIPIIPIAVRDSDANTITDDDEEEDVVCVNVDDSENELSETEYDSANEDSAEEMDE